MERKDRIVKNALGAMDQMVGKLKSVEREVSSEKGDFRLFVLLLREDARDRWDLLVSAPWLEANKRDGLEYLVNKLQVGLDAQERLSLSRVVILEEDNPVLAAVQRIAGVSHGRLEMRDIVVNGIEIRQAYVITSKQD